MSPIPSRHRGRSPAGFRTIRRRPVSRRLASVGATLLLALTAGAARGQSAAPWPSLDVLRAEIERAAEAAQGVVGVGVRHLESGQELFVNGEVRFPLASTYKVPIAVALLTRVDRGELRLDQTYVLQEDELRRTASILVEHLLPGSAPTLENLLTLMLQHSDNVATDILLRLVGGSRGVTSRMRELGLAIRVDRPTWAIILNSRGETWVSEENPVSRSQYAELLGKERSPEARDAALEAFDRDPQDTGTPAAMTELLTKIVRGEILSGRSTELLIDIMYGTRTGAGRLRGKLPAGTRVSHKTGTIGRTTNDVGIIDLPGGAGHVVTVVYIKESRLPTPAEREPVIAEIARIVHDYFTFHAPRSASSPAALDLSRLEAEIRRLAEVPAGAVGVGVRHIESGREVYVNGDRAFLMGSTYKIPIAARLLSLVDHGGERLDRLVPLEAGDLFPSGSLLSQRFRAGQNPGASLSLARYLELMLILSDNAATDVILRQVGGPAAVTGWVRAQGVADLRVDRTVMEIYQEYIGIETLPPHETRSLETFTRLAAAVPPHRTVAAQRAFHAAEKDRSTPRAMIQLLERMFRGEALGNESTALLLSIMRREETGASRIRGLLPEGTRVANKTGTIGEIVANDVGIIDLPGGAGHLTIAVFTDDPTLSAQRQSRIIAEVARAAYSFFTFEAGAR